MNHHEVNLPQFMEAFIIGKPEFTTQVADTISGRSCRIITRNQSYQRYVIKNCRLNYEQFTQFNNFFRGRRGQTYSFRIRDLADYKVAQQFIAIGDNSKQEYQIFKSYPDPVNPYNRTIKKLIENTVKVYVDDSIAAAKIHYNTGIIILPDKLPQGKKLIVDFMFDVSVRFLKDSFEYGYAPDGSIAINDIELLEVQE